MSIGRVCFSNQASDEDDHSEDFTSMRCVHIVDHKMCLKNELELLKETSHRLQYIGAYCVSLMEILFGH